MHILVPIKRVVDYNVKIRVNSDGTDIEARGVKMSLNPFDEVALAQAVRMKEQGIASKITAVTCGTPIAQDVLRTALAIGADAAVLIETVNTLEPLGVARLLHALVMSEKVDLVLCGKQAIDDDLGATGPMLAALLDWPQAISVNQLRIEDSELKVTCDADDGVEELALQIPAVVSVDLRLCDPRNITLPAMMRAKKTSICIVNADKLANTGPLMVQVLGVSEPTTRAAGLRLDGLPSLLKHLCKLPALQQS